MRFCVLEEGIHSIIVLFGAVFLDEIFSSVDAAGVYEIVKILNDISKENNLNTWVINHTELPMELFDKKVEAVKEGGFSKLTIENIT